MLTAADALARVHAELGAPPITVLDPRPARPLRLALEGERWHPTIAALVVAGRHPERVLPRCAVELAVDGERRELGGALPMLLAQVADGLIDGVDATVLAQALLNAVLYRDGSLDARVRVTLTGERLEVASPGALTADPPRPAALRNPLLVHLAVALGLTGGAGRGLRRVAARLEAQRLRAFTLLERQGEVCFIAQERRARAAVPSPPRGGWGRRWTGSPGACASCAGDRGRPCPRGAPRRWGFRRRGNPSRVGVGAPGQRRSEPSETSGPLDAAQAGE